MPCLMVILWILIIVVIVVAVFYAVQILAVAGAVYGAGIALRNYVLAFYHNVKLERAGP